jgi:hypothetical protein
MIGQKKRTVTPRKRTNWTILFAEIPEYQSDQPACEANDGIAHQGIVMISA